VRKNCTPGTVRGAPGNRRPYRGDLATMPIELRFLIIGTKYARARDKLLSIGTQFAAKIYRNVDEVEALLQPTAA